MTLRLYHCPLNRTKLKLTNFNAIYQDEYAFYIAVYGVRTGYCYDYGYDYGYGYGYCYGLIGSVLYLFDRMVTRNRGNSARVNVENQFFHDKTTNCLRNSLSTFLFFKTFVVVSSFLLPAFISLFVNTRLYLLYRRLSQIWNYLSIFHRSFLIGFRFSRLLRTYLHGMILGKAVVTNISTGLRPSLRAPAAKVAPVLRRVLQPSSSGIDHRRRRYQPVHRPGRKKLSFSSLKIRQNVFANGQ